MRIIRIPIPQAEPAGEAAPEVVKTVPAPVPMPLPPPAPVVDLRPLMDLKEQLRLLQESFEQAHALAADQLKKNSTAVSQWTDEIAALRKAIAYLPAEIAKTIPAPATVMAPLPAPPPVKESKPLPVKEEAAAPVETPAPSELLDAIAGVLEEEKPKRKASKRESLF